jgi:hypothetical protein
MGRRPRFLFRAAGSLALLAALFVPPPSSAQVPDQPLTPAEIDSLELYLVASLAGPDERAFQQILTDAHVLPDPTDSNVVYDIVVRYDPERYHTAVAGLYPLSFEDQFIQWGKRIALFTRSINPATKRWFLHDISTGRQAWMFTAEARHLYGPPPEATPATVAVDARPGQLRWRRLMYAAPAGTDLLQMTGWLSRLRRESRDAVIARVGVHQPATSP